MSSLALSNWIRALLASAIAVSSIIGSALAANAVTNPADNPAPITVQGDDGNTYHDGEDTLPGYDDEECTYIPGAWFDFANNRVHYADGQSIAWTEWDRASGYREWLANRSNSNSNNDTETTAGETTTTTTTKSGKTTTSKSTATNTNSDEAEAAQTTEVTATAVDGEVPPVALAAVSGAEKFTNPGRETGLTILISLFGAGALLVAASELKTRALRKEKA
mgnify:FL=1